MTSLGPLHVQESCPLPDLISLGLDIAVSEILYESPFQASPASFPVGSGLVPGTSCLPSATLSPMPRANLRWILMSIALSVPLPCLLRCLQPRVWRSCTWGRPGTDWWHFWLTCMSLQATLREHFSGCTFLPVSLWLSCLSPSWQLFLLLASGTLESPGFLFPYKPVTLSCFLSFPGLSDLWMSRPCRVVQFLTAESYNLPGIIKPSPCVTPHDSSASKPKQLCRHRRSRVWSLLTLKLPPCSHHHHCLLPSLNSFLAASLTLPCSLFSHCSFCFSHPGFLGCSFHKLGMSPPQGLWPIYCPALNFLPLVFTWFIPLPPSGFSSSVTFQWGLPWPLCLKPNLALSPALTVLSPFPAVFSPE